MTPTRTSGIAANSTSPTTNTSPPAGLSIPSSSTVLPVAEPDFGIHIPTLTMPPGNYVFVDTNHGPSAHELVMWKTALTAGHVPVGANSKVNEDSPALESALDSG